MNKLLVFTAEWCRPCRRLKSNLANLADEYANNVKNYDIDIQQEIAIRHRVEVVPTLITLDESGNEVSRVWGIQSVEDLERLIKNV